MKVSLAHKPVYVLGEEGVDPAYPCDVDLGNLNGPEGNVIVIAGRIASALRQVAGREEAEAFTQRSLNRPYQETIEEATQLFRCTVTSVPQAFLDD